MRAGYVSHLEEALKNRRIVNIALTGNYGIGKVQHPRRSARQSPGAGP
jgi:hypothetical protein